MKTLLYIDYDNFNSEFEMENLFQYIENEKIQIVKKYAFCSNGDIHSINNKTKKYGLELRFITPFKKTSESTDIAMTLDIASNILNNKFNKFFDTIILASKDYDFLPVANFIKSNGKKVFLITSNNEIDEDYFKYFDGYLKIEKQDFSKEEKKISILKDEIQKMVEGAILNFKKEIFEQQTNNLYQTFLNNFLEILKKEEKENKEFVRLDLLGSQYFKNNSKTIRDELKINKNTSIKDFLSKEFPNLFDFKNEGSTTYIKRI